MSDLISRQTAIDALAKTMPTPTTPDGAGEFDHEIHIADEAFADAIRIIESLEPADVVPVVHARWVSKPNIYGVAYCSKCDYELHTNDTNYCPNCGAKMDAQGEE